MGGVTSPEEFLTLSSPSSSWYTGRETMTAWTVLMRNCPHTHPVTQHTARPNQAEYSQAAVSFPISVQKFQLLDCLLTKVSINTFCDIAVFLYLARKSLPQSKFLFKTFFFPPERSFLLNYSIS